MPQSAVGKIILRMASPHLFLVVILMVHMVCNSSIAGGRGNNAAGEIGSVIGGSQNNADGKGSTLAGGLGNTGVGMWSSVFGGSKMKL